MQRAFISYSSCPACNSNRIHLAFIATDHSVSHDAFEIWQCENCSLRFTQNIPGADSMKIYYRSADYISHTDTSKGLVNRLYHIVRRRTLAGKYRLLSSALKRRPGDSNARQHNLLDIGAGTGAFVRYMQKNGWHATGLEPDEDARKRARAIQQVELLPLEALDAINENSFDAITLWHVLEHIEQLHSCLDQIKKILKANGRIFIAVPNYTAYDASVYKNYWAAYDVPRHLYHFSPAAMKQLLAKHALKLHQIRPMWWDSFYISLLSEKYKTGHSNIIRGLFTGAVSNLKALADKEYCSSLIYLAGKS